MTGTETQITHPAWCSLQICQAADERQHPDDRIHFSEETVGMVLSLYENVPRTPGGDKPDEGPETVTVYLQQHIAAMDQDPHLHIWQQHEDHVMRLTMLEAVALAYTLHEVITSADPAAGDLLPKGPVTR